MTLIRIHIFVSSSDFLLVLAPIASTRRRIALRSEQRTEARFRQRSKLFGPQSGRYRYDKTMLNAARIAADRARAHSTSSCWRYVKNALLAAKTIDSYPETVYAKAGRRWSSPRTTASKDFRCNDPYAAPLGSVLVYGGRGAGHVEIRTATGFVSDFESLRPRRVR